MGKVEKTSKSLPALLAETQTKLQTLLSTAQKLSLERHTLTDQLSGLVDGLDAPVQYHDGAVDGGADAGATTLLQQMADLQDELARLEAGLTWATVLEKVLSLRCVLISSLTIMGYADCCLDYRKNEKEPSDRRQLTHAVRKPSLPPPIHLPH